MMARIPLDHWLRSAMDDWSDAREALLLRLATGESAEVVLTRERLTASSDAAAIVADFQALAQSEADAHSATVVWAVALVHDGERVTRSTAQRAEPTKETRVFTSGAEGTNQMLQHIVLEFAKHLTAVHSAQARHIESQTRIIEELRQKEIDAIAVREALASKQHIRELEETAEVNRARLQEEFLSYVREAMSRTKSPIEGLGLTAEQKAKLAEAAAEVLDGNQLSKLGSLLGDANNGG